MRLTRRIKRLIGDDRGSPAIEFAMIAPFLLMLMLGILDLGLTLFTQVVLDGAARDAARQIRTGQIAGGGQAAFEKVLANDTSALIPSGAIVYYVNVLPNFSSASAPTYSPAGVDANNNPTPAGFGNPALPKSYTPGGPSSEMIVTVAYQRTSLVPFLGNWIGAAWGSSTLMSTVVFQNEPGGGGGG